MQGAGGNYNNFFVDDAEVDISELSDGPKAKFELKPNQAQAHTVEETPKAAPPVKMEGVNKSSPASNSRKPTMDISDLDKSEHSSHKSEYTPCSNNSKKRRKRRRDVIFKTILRECRRYFQIQLSNLTGFITSKKPRNDDYMYSCMKRFNIEALGKQGTFDENFYLACLLYPQDLTRNMDSFIKEKGAEDFDAARKEYKQIAQKIHDTLYKYSHDKLDFFVSKMELAFLFCYFYEKGAGAEKSEVREVKRRLRRDVGEPGVEA